MVISYQSCPSQKIRGGDTVWDHHKPLLSPAPILTPDNIIASILPFLTGNKWMRKVRMNHWPTQHKCSQWYLPYLYHWRSNATTNTTIPCCWFKIHVPTAMSIGRWYPSQTSSADHCLVAMPNWRKNSQSTSMEEDHIVPLSTARLKQWTTSHDDWLQLDSLKYYQTWILAIEIVRGSVKVLLAVEHVFNQGCIKVPLTRTRQSNCAWEWLTVTAWTDQSTVSQCYYLPIRQVLFLENNL